MPESSTKVLVLQAPRRPIRSQGTDLFSGLKSTLATGPRVAAIYARYSTPAQGVRSEMRQDGLGKAYADKLGVEYYRTFSDRGETGMALAHRHELENMLNDAREGRFNVLIVEGVDRLSRKMSDLNRIFRQLADLGVEIHEVNGTHITPITMLFRGLQAQEERRTFLARASEGRNRAVRNGLVPGRIRYGYAKGAKPGILALHPVLSAA